MPRPLLLALCLAAPALGQPRTDAHGDPLPTGAVTRFGTLRDRIGSPRVLWSWALSPDGRTLATETRQGITLWDVDTGRVTRRLPGRTWQGSFPRFALVFSPDGKRLARVAGRVVAVWDLTTGTEVFNIDLKDEGTMQGIAFVPGADELLVTGDDKARAWTLDARTGRIVRSVEIGGGFRSLRPAGPFIAGYEDKTWILFDPTTGKARFRFPPMADSHQTLAVSPDGRRAWAATDAGRLRAVDTQTGQVLQDLDPPAGYKSGDSRVAVSPDGAVVYLGGHQPSIYRRDVNAGKWLPPIEPALPGELLPHPDGKRLLVVGNDGVLRRYDLTTLKRLPGADGFEIRVVAAAARDGRVVIDSGSSGENARLDLFDSSGRPVWTVRPERLADWGATRWSPDGRWLFCVGHSKVHVRDPATGRVVRTLDRPPGEDGFMLGGFLSADGSRLVVPCQHSPAVYVFHPGAETPPTAIRPDVWAPMDLSPDGRSLVYVTRDRGVRLFDLAAGRFTARTPGPEIADRRTVDFAPRFSPDGSYLLTWERETGRDPRFPPNTLAVLRDPVTLARVREFDADGPQDEMIAISPDGLWLAIGRYGGRWSLWDVPTGKRLATFEGHRDYLTSIHFAGPGRVVTGSGDLTALVWDLDPNQRPKGGLWESLSGKDADEAFRATWALAADPKGPERLRSKIAPVPAPPVDKVRQWLTDLGADKFPVREAATKVLLELGRVAEPDLRAARAKAATEEERTRLDAILAKIPRERTATEVIQARAAQAMELARTEAARKVLAEWAAGAPGARLTIDAKAALARLR